MIDTGADEAEDLIAGFGEDEGERRNRTGADLECCCGRREARVRPPGGTPDPPAIDLERR